MTWTVLILMGDTTTPTPPHELDFEKGLMFFHAYMYGPLQGKLRLYRARNVSPTTAASPSDWEVFASILLGEPGTRSQVGIDLLGYEVKSAQEGSSFEYQYHRDSWAEKLGRDMQVGHLFFSHRDNLQFVRLYRASGSDLAGQFFRKWYDDCPYPRDPSVLRYRKNIPYGWVRQNARLLMELTDGEVKFPPGKAQ